MSGFSGAVKLSGLDDFITPSQACVKPVQIDKTDADVERVERGHDGSLVEIRRDGTQSKLKAAQITLNDCLACSGCVTSAESVLVSQQSLEQFVTLVEEFNGRNGVVIVSVAPQCISSLAVAFNVSQHQAAGMLNSSLQSLGAHAMVSITMATAMHLSNVCHEAESNFHNTNSSGQQSKPLLHSGCPGWVCYAEKTQHECVPLLSKVKSPQGIQGILVKTAASKVTGKSRTDIMHACLMPCFDKKLEASRPVFETMGAKDVDIVISPLELVEYLAQKGTPFTGFPTSDLAHFSGSSQLDGLAEMAFRPSGDGFVATGHTSDGVAEHVFRHVAMQVFGEAASPNWKRVRNSDFLEATFTAKDGKSFKVAKCYGFRNIQNIVRAVKGPRGCPYLFVEMMACPSGCVNGGAQARPEQIDDPRAAKQKAVDTLGTNDDNDSLASESAKGFELLAKIASEGGESSQILEQLLSVEYIAVAPTGIVSNPLAIQW